MIRRSCSRYLATAWLSALLALLVLLVLPPLGPPSALAEDLLSQRDLERSVAALDLDAASRAAVTQILDEVKRANEPRETAFRKEEAALQSLLDRDPPDAPAVSAHLDAVAKLQREIWGERIRGWIEVRARLTPAQRRELPQLGSGPPSEVEIACRRDLRTLCPEARGVRTSMTCLIEHREKVSDGCRAELVQGPLGSYFAIPGAR